MVVVLTVFLAPESPPHPTSFSDSDEHTVGDAWRFVPEQPLDVAEGRKGLTNWVAKIWRRAWKRRSRTCPVFRATGNVRRRLLPSNSVAASLAAQRVFDVSYPTALLLSRDDHDCARFAA